MRDDTILTKDDEGKTVKHADGDEVGRVIEVENGTAHIEPDPSLADTIRSKLGWAESGEDTYQLNVDSVESVTDDAIRLSR